MAKQIYQVFVLDTTGVYNINRTKSTLCRCKFPRAVGTEGQGQNVDDEKIESVLKYIFDTAINCSEGNPIYWTAGNKPFAFPRPPRLISPEKSIKPLGNPRHTKLTWKRTLLTHQKRIGQNTNTFQPAECPFEVNIANEINCNCIKVHTQNCTKSPNPNLQNCLQIQLTDNPVSEELKEIPSQNSEVNHEMPFRRKPGLALKDNNKEKDQSDINNNEDERNSSSSSNESVDSTAVQHGDSIDSISLTSSVTTINNTASQDQFCQTDGEVHLTERLTKLYNDLKSLWLDVNKLGIVPHINDFSATDDDHKLGLVNLCSFIVKEMETEWRNFSSFSAVSDKASQLAETNRLLREQLENAHLNQSCLETELKYMAKDKSNLNHELKQLSMQLATMQKNEITKTAATRIKKSLSTTSSLGFDLCPSISNEDLDFQITTTNNNYNRVQKREDDFNNLMEVVQSHHKDMDFYKTQFDKYDEEITALENEINIIKVEKSDLEGRYNELIYEHQTVLKETEHYETVLKLVLKEKETTGKNLYDLIQDLIRKVNEMESSNANALVHDSNKLVLLEGALESTREQNANYKEEITLLKSKLESLSSKMNNGQSELELCYEQSQRKIQELTKRLEEKAERVMCDEEIMRRKEIQWEDRFTASTFEKEKLENLLEERDFELKKHKNSIEGFEKRTLRQEKRIQELHKCNNKLKHEIQEQRNNMESLNNIVNQLRTSLKEQKSQWSDRIKATNEDANHAKDHCRWLQNQIEQLNKLLSEAHDRIKLHERDKSNLAQQILYSEEERKLVDRKLHELRTALQGDTVLREALMERNEILQAEISRLRRAKIASLGKTIDSWKDDGDFESSTLESVVPLPIMPPPSSSASSPVQVLHHSSAADKGIIRKNCYTAAFGTNRRPIDIPRSTASMTTSGLNSSSNNNANPNPSTSTSGNYQPSYPL